MVKEEVVPFKLADGKEVHMKEWRPDSKPVAKVVFVHGFNDHIDRYYELFPTLASRGIIVVGWDQRGWGRTAKKPSERGVSGPTSQVIEDIVYVIRSQLPSEIPVFVMGHSMGGAEVLHLASTPKYKDVIHQIRGWILESPHVALPPAEDPGALKIIAGRWAGKLLPQMNVKGTLAPENLTRDPAVVESIKADPLMPNIGTLQGLTGLFDRASDLENGRVKLHEGVKAIWLAHGTADGGTYYLASKKWFDKQTAHVADREFKTYEGWQHQLHADHPETRPVFAKDVGDWIIARSGSTDGKNVEAELDGTAPDASASSSTAAGEELVREAIKEPAKL